MEIRENITTKVRSMRSFADMQIAFQNLSRRVNAKALICAGCVEAHFNSRSQKVKKSKISNISKIEVKK